MKKMTRFSSFLLLAIMVSLATISTSCSKKSGCPAEDAHINTDKNGNYKTGKTRSGLGLVPKDANKRSKN